MTASSSFGSPRKALREHVGTVLGQESDTLSDRSLGYRANRIFNEYRVIVRVLCFFPVLAGLQSALWGCVRQMEAAEPTPVSSEHRGQVYFLAPNLPRQRTSSLLFPTCDQPRCSERSIPDWPGGITEKQTSRREERVTPSVVLKRAPARTDRSGILRDYGLLLASQQFLLMRWSTYRRALKGPFFKDYVDSVSHLKQGFWDGDHWFWDGIMHPIQGGITYQIALTRGASEWESFVWAATYSVHYELGPLGQTGIGNIRVSPIDLLVTPTAGVLWVKIEGWLDSKISRMADQTDRKVFRCLLPARAITNLLRFRTPWDRRKVE